MDAFRSARRGALEPGDGLALLRAAGHADADLHARLVSSLSDTRGVPPGFISGVRDATS